MSKAGFGGGGELERLIVRSSLIVGFGGSAKDNAKGGRTGIREGRYGEPGYHK
jgi:hypothetical protein